MKTRKAEYEPIIRYSYEELVNQQVKVENPQIEAVKEVKKDTFTKSKEPINIKYKSQDGIVIAKGKESTSSINNEVEDIELPHKLATKLILEQELASKEEQEEYKKAV